MTISFAWTTPALLLGKKSVTRRDWHPKTILQARRSMESKEPVKAYSRAQYRGGEHVADIRITEIIEDEDSRLLAPVEWVLEGFHVLQAIGAKIDGSTAADVWRFWTQENTEPQTAIRFELLRLTERGEHLQLEAEQQLTTAGGPVSFLENTMAHFVIYQNPVDHPGKFVVRRWDIGKEVKPGPCTLHCSLDMARASIPAGQVRFPRSFTDDPCIVETWI